MTIRILLVDDEANVVNAIARTLKRDWHNNAMIETHTHAARALARAAQDQFDAVISDYRMPEMDGIDFLTRFRALQPLTARIILSGNTDFDVLMTAINEAGILRFISKPWDDDELLRATRLAVDTTAANRESQRLAEAHAKGDAPPSGQQAEMQRLEALEPGITKVRWGPNGEVLLEDD